MACEGGECSFKHDEAPPEESKVNTADKDNTADSGVVTSSSMTAQRH